MAEKQRIGTMDRKRFQAWLSVVDGLSEAQKAKAMDVLAGRPVGEAAVAAVELGVGEDRRCPRCGTTGAVSSGTARGLKRYRCKGCGKTFGALTGTPLSGLHRKEMWLTFGERLSDGDTVKTSAERCGVAVSTAFRWRHRFLRAVESGACKLRGIVEADETFILARCKGSRAWKQRLSGILCKDRCFQTRRKRSSNRIAN
jgi:transposase-like protein